MGEGGAARGGAILAAFIVVGIALFATIDDAQDAGSAASDQTANTTAGGPCGGAATVPASVTSSSVGGLSDASSMYDVKDVRIASSDPAWGRFSAVAKPGQESSFQNGYGVVHCTSDGWEVTAFGSIEVGCSGSDAPPPAVKTELELSCPS